MITLNPRRARLASLGALLGGRALTLDYYDDRRLHRWVRETIAKQGIDAALVFSSSMVQYLKAWPSLPALVDLVDVDSAKWAQYAGEHRWPISWLYRREGERLLAYEREVVDKAAKSFLVTDKEVALFIIGELLSGGMRSFVRWGAEALKAAGWIPGAQIAEAAILAVGAVVAGATTFGVGKAAIQYFQSGRSLDSGALRMVFDAAAWDYKRRGEAATV